MKNKATSEINRVDKVISSFIKADPDLNSYIVSRRKVIGIPINGFNRQDSLKVSQIDFNKLAKDLVDTAIVIMVCYKLAERWLPVILSYILLNDIVDPDPNVRVTKTANGLVVEVHDWAAELHNLNYFLSKNNIKDMKSKTMLKSTNKDLEDFSLDLKIMQLKHEGLSSKRIADVLRQERRNKLPVAFYQKDSERSGNRTPADVYINNHYSELSRLLRKNKLKPSIHVARTHMILVKLGKI